MKKLLLVSSLILTLSGGMAYAEESDVSLITFIQNVRDNHPAFKRFEAMKQKADAQAHAMSAYRYNPEFEFEGESQNDAEETRVYGISQALDISGKIFVQKHVAQQLLLSQKAGISQQRADYLAALIKALAAYESANRVIQLAQEQAALMDRFTDIGEKRSKVGDVGSTELALARLAGAEAQSRLADATASWETARAELNIRCNCALETVPTLIAEPPALVFSKNWQQLAMELPAYRAAQAADEAAKQNMRLKRRERIPDPTVNVGTGREGRTNLLTFGVSIPIPVLNTGSPEVREAEAESVETAATFHEVRTRLVADLERQSRIYTGHQKALSSWRKLAQPSLGDYTKALEKQWDAGELSASDYLLQVKQGIETAMTGAAIKAHAWGAWADWMALTGQIEFWVNKTVFKEKK